MSRTISIAATLALWVLAAAASCGSYEKWPQTDEFLQRLRCGMSEEEVASVVAEFPELEFRDSGRGAPWDKVAAKGSTTIALDFDESGLRRAEAIWVTGVLSAKASPVKDFCLSELLPEG